MEWGVGDRGWLFSLKYILIMLLALLLVLRIELFNHTSREAPFAMDGTHTHTHTHTGGTSDCMAKILSSFYTSLSRLWRNGRAQERYPTRRVSFVSKW